MYRQPRFLIRTFCKHWRLFDGDFSLRVSLNYLKEERHKSMPHCVLFKKYIVLASRSPKVNENGLSEHFLKTKSY